MKGPPKKKNLIGREKNAEPEPEEPKLQCLQIDITDPLTKDEWGNFLEVISATNGLGWFQILPVGQKSSTPLQFNMLHVLPQANIPFRRLPIDQFVASYHSTRRKEERGEMSKAMPPFAKEVRTQRIEMEETAIAQNLYMIKEF